MGKKVLEDCGKLKNIRDYIIDWVLLESEVSPTEDFCQALVNFLEELGELKSRPAELNPWSDTWFEAHSLFVYETFLYLIAALLKTCAYQILHEVFTTNYLYPGIERYGNSKFYFFDYFYGSSNTLQKELAPDGVRLFSPAAELIKRHADREDLPFITIIEAELLILMMVFLNPNTSWYPQTFFYSSYSSEFPFFIRATQHKHFLRLAAITGINDADQLREAVREGQKRLGVSQWHDFHFGDTFWTSMNMDKLDSIK